MTEQPEAEVAWRRPDRALLGLRRQLTVVLFTLPGVVGAVVLTVLFGPAAGVAAVTVVAVLTWLTLGAVTRRWAAWGYLEREDDLLVRRGVLLRRTSVVPYGRMQFVDVTAGPLQRRVGLATVTLHTAAAATDASVPGLLTAEAARLRDRLAALGEARQAGGVTATSETDGWLRLHPLTPLLRGGRFLLVALAIVGQQGLRDASLEVFLAVVGVGVPLALSLGWLLWRAMRYRLTDTELQVESGVLTKRSRRVPLARLQSVDVVRPLFARFLGLAELRLEVVGGSGGAEAPLSYLGEQEAHRLRVRLLDLAAGRSAGDGSVPAEQEQEQVLVVVPAGPLVWSTLLGPPLVVGVGLVVVLVIAAVVDLTLVGGVLLGAVPLLIGVGSFAVRRMLTEYGFTVAESGDGLRLRHGLLETRSSTIPAGRVQTVRITEPLLWRPFGWARVEVDVAGYSAGGGEEQASTGALLPVAPLEFAHRLVARVLGGAPPPVGDRPPRAARWRAPLSHRRLAIGLDDFHVVSTHGVLTTTTEVVPLAKVQSLRLTQGPWQRRLGLTSLHVDTAGRRLPGTVAAHRGDVEAARLLADITNLARAARRASP